MFRYQWAVLGALVPAIVSAQRAAIAGRVSDSASRAPIAGAQVRVVGTDLVATTRSDGTYRLTGVAPGVVTLRALRLGFQQQTNRATVGDSGVTTVDFALTASAVQLDLQIVTAAGTTEREREIGNSIATITVDSLSKAAVTSFSDVLQGRAAGVVVSLNSGETGAGQQIRIRGNNSITQANQPLLVIDGVRADNTESSGLMNAGGQEPSRFDDLSPDEIESIEILKGPAASALYGTLGANGVIQVTTKHGIAGGTRWTANLEGGTVRDVTDYPSNYAREGTPTNACTLSLAASGGCVPGALLSFNPLEANDAFIGGYREATGLSAAGGTDVTTFFVAGDYYREQGVYANNSTLRLTGRANVRVQLSRTIDATFNAGYVQGRTELPLNDNQYYGLIADALDGYAVNDPITHGFLQGVGPAQLAQIHNKQSADRTTLGVTANWKPLPWLSFIGTAGLDQNALIDAYDWPAGLVPTSGGGSLAQGIAITTSGTQAVYTGNLTGTAQYAIAPSLRGTTTAGTQYAHDLTDFTTAGGTNLTEGITGVGGTTQPLAPTDLRPEEVTIGGFLQQGFAWRDRVFLTVAGRADGNSAVGRNTSLTYYPSASLSWVVGEFPVVSSVRLRAAFGESGQRFSGLQALTYYVPISQRKGGVDSAAVIPGEYGNANLKPEISTEYEGGADLGFWHDRITAQFTYYDKTTRDAIVEQPIDPSTGADSIPVNLGKVSNRGFEILVSGRLLDTRPLAAELTVNGSVNHNRLIQLGQGVVATGYNIGDGGYTQKNQPGYSLGGFWAYPYTYKSISDITVGPQEVFFGNSQPTDEFSVIPTLTFFRFFKVSATFDRHAGALAYDATEEYRCVTAGPPDCREIFDPRTSLRDQVAAAAAANSLSDAGWYYNGSFWKWRELAMTVSAPTRWAKHLGASAVSLTVAGRNLATWTKYPGLDPELNYLPGGSGFTRAEYFGQPPVQYWTVRVTATW